MSLLGMPPSGGFVGKWLLLRAALEEGQWWWALVVLSGSLRTAGYLFRILRRAFAPLPEGGAALRQVSRSAELVALALAGVAIWIGMLAALPLGLLRWPGGM
jgi:NADH:ubiquinone oxidoreductase subunit 2 (subunit N)